MNNDFPRILTFLRKERGLTQKQAAAELGISQALLSHYEKGIRECGLDFLIKAADYYEVTTDYLLGRTLQRSAVPQAESTDDEAEQERVSGSMINRINRKVIANAGTVIYDLLAQVGSRRLTNSVSNYLMCAHYEVFRLIYSAEPTNTQTLFSLEQNRYKSCASAAMILELEVAENIIAEEHIAPALSPDILSGYFDKAAASLFSLIQFSERNIRGCINQNLK
ncbi:MAG: helix-turn-helix transcriptional regulator [Ruminococcus sp.]|nr:helix-turn-helix transcriptional regulator [Ruminococcus sp.]